MGWTSRSTAYLRRKNRGGGRGRIHKKKGYVFQARRQQPAKLQSLSSFLRGGGSIQSFPFRLQTIFLFIYLFFGSAVAVHLPHLKRRALECMLTLFPGVLAEQRAYCWVEHRFTRYANSFAAHRLWGAGFSNLSPTDQHRLKLYSFIPQTNHS